MFDIKQALKKSVLGLATVATLGATTLAASSADAHPRGWGPGAAVGAGILGLAIGASLARPPMVRPRAITPAPATTATVRLAVRPGAGRRTTAATCRWSAATDPA
jgi:hypothetical protein